MNEQNTIPLLREVIHRGQMAPDETVEDIKVDDTPFDEADIMPLETDDEIEQEYHAALQEIQAEQQEIEFDIAAPAAAAETANELDPAPAIRELLIDEEIRMILQRHMDDAYREIIKLISHKIS